MRIPFPNLRSGLATKDHMYICVESVGMNKQFVECQSLKPKMLGNPMFKNFIDEHPDISRNPFTRDTRIDLDYTFGTTNSTYKRELLARIMQTVHNDLYADITSVLNLGQHKIEFLNEVQLKALNHPNIY